MNRILLLCSFLLLGAVRTSSPAVSSPKPLLRRAVAITFDDLPAPSDSVVSNDPAALQAMTARLLMELKANRIPAIGFVNEGKLNRGDQFEARVAILKMWLDSGFQLGNHTYSHLDIDSTPLPEYEADVIRGETVTRQLLRERGMPLRYFRYPFLDVGKTLVIKRAFERFLAGRGYRVAPVTIDNEEYMFAAVYAHALAHGDTVIVDRVAESFLAYMQQVFSYFETFSVEVLGREPRQVLLLHADALDTDELDSLARILRARGYRFISLRQALRDPAYRLPDNYVDGGGVSWINHWAHTLGKSIPDGPEVPAFIQRLYTAEEK